MAFEPNDGQISDFLARRELGRHATQEDLIQAFNRWQDLVTGLGRRTGADGRSIVIEVTPTSAEADLIAKAREEPARRNEALHGPQADEHALSAYLALFN